MDSTWRIRFETLFISSGLIKPSDMEYLCYTLEESRYVRENVTAQRMVIDTMKGRVGICSILAYLLG